MLFSLRILGQWPPSFGFSSDTNENTFGADNISLSAVLIEANISVETPLAFLNYFSPSRLSSKENRKQLPSPSLECCAGKGSFGLSTPCSAASSVVYGALVASILYTLPSFMITAFPNAILEGSLSGVLRAMCQWPRLLSTHLQLCFLSYLLLSPL